MLKIIKLIIKIIMYALIAAVVLYAMYTFKRVF